MPYDEQFNQIIDDEDCLGTSLGIAIVMVKLNETMEKKITQDFGDGGEAWAHPPFLALYGIDGHLYTYKIFQD